MCEKHSTYAVRLGGASKASYRSLVAPKFDVHFSRKVTSSKRVARLFLRVPFLRGEGNREETHSY